MSGKKVVKGEDVCPCNAEPPKKPCPPPQNITHPLRYYEFTHDEIKALEECDKESFYQRCLPFSTIFATATYAAMKYGWLNRNPHFGATPKVVVAAFLGHMFGRLSYVPHCERKLRERPGFVGDIMRKYHGATCTEDPKKKK